ncbi:ABC transporter substrate-binding protein [Paenibacillus sp. GYB003]|uniref:ABC transporter substrate-binding protein n=1 Tax=Paenibacillus sp. GYB003 TaxID=2994392 RepID=UPI002F96230F
MMRKWKLIGLASVLLLGLTACGAKEEVQPAGGSAGDASAAGAANATAAASPRTISYLGKAYTVPAKTDKLVITGALEAMEDALVLGVKPVGAITVGGKFHSLFASITDGTQGIGEKTQPNIETILKLKPDVILSSTKFPAETAEKLGKVGTTIPVSHISTDWEANLNLLAELTGKQERAKQVLQTYKNDVKTMREQIAPVFKDKKVLAVRIRTGSINLYPADVFFNPSLYEDLGAAVPEEIKQAKAQQIVSLEKFSEMNPDYLFVQFAEDENKDTPKALDDLQNNPIWKSINAVKNGRVYVNVVDPLAQGGTAYSKIRFLEAVKTSGIVPTK